MSYRTEVVTSFANEAKKLGFRVFIAEKQTHGFITDAEGTRVLSFENDLCGIKLSGNYEPGSGNGSGWGMDPLPKVTKEDLKRCLYAHSPGYIRHTKPVVYTTMESHLKRYGQSSRYQEIN